MEVKFLFNFQNNPNFCHGTITWNVRRRRKIHSHTIRIFALYIVFLNLSQ